MDSQEETIVRLERELRDALARRDMEALERLVADDFIGINSVNMEVTKADLLVMLDSHDYMAEGDLPDYMAEGIVNDVLRVRLFGDVAVVVTRRATSGTYRAVVPGAAMLSFYTRVWAKRDGRWEAVADHESRSAG
jgi:ketosteroid isomerase-like protein